MCVARLRTARSVAAGKPSLNRAQVSYNGPARELFEDDEEGKTYEHFFFKSTRDGRNLEGVILPLNPEHATRYATVLRSYSAQQQAPGGDEHLLNRAAATHPAPSDNALSDGDLVFV